MSLTAFAFAIMYVSGLLAGLFWRPIYAFYTYIAVFYLHPPSRWWGLDLPDLRWSLIAAIITLIATLRLDDQPQKDSWLSSGAVQITIIFTSWFWIQSLWALNPEDHLDAAIIFTKYAALFYMMYKLLDSERSLYGFCLAHVIGCTFLGWLVLQSNLTGRLDGVGGPGIDTSNPLSMQLITGMICAGILLMRGPIVVRCLMIVAIPLIGNGYIQNQGRGALVGLIFGGLAMMYLLPRESRKLFYALAVVAALAMVQLVPENFWARMQTIVVAAESVSGIEIFDFENQPDTIDGASETRVDLIEAQWDFFKRYPLGTGHRGTKVLTNDYFIAKGLDHGKRSSHNTFMTALSEQGVFGVMLFLAMVAWVWRSLRWLKRLDKQGFPVSLGLLRAAIGGSLVSILFSGMFSDFLKAEVLLWLFTMLAVLLDLSRQWQQSQRPELIGEQRLLDAA